MSKTKWYVKAIYIVFAVALVLGFTLAPSAVSANGPTRVPLKFAVSGNGAAAWDTAHLLGNFGAYSAKLNGGVQGGNDYAAVVIPMDGTTLLSSITSFKYDYYAATGTEGYPHVCFYTHDPDDDETGEITLYSGGAPYPGQAQGWNEITVTPTSPAATGNSGFFWWGTETTPGTCTQGLPNTYTLGTFQAQGDFANHVIDRIQIEFGWWSVGTTGDTWVDKAELAAGSSFLYDFEPFAINATCYKTGDVVNVTMYNAFGTADTYAGWAYSDTVGEGGKITISLTNQGNGLFTGSFALAGQLLTTNGDQIYVQCRSNWGPGWQTIPWADLAVVDNTAPVVTFIPANGTRVSGAAVNIDSTITEANARTDTITIDELPKTFADPYVWNTTTYADGAHTVVLTSTDCAGNVGTDTKSYTVDNTKPGVTLTSAATSPTKLPIPVRATFTEAVASFVAGNITLGGVGGTITTGPTPVTPGVYDFTVTPNGQGVVTIDIAAGIVNDTATPANTNTASNTLTYTYDSVAPTVVTLSSTAPDPTDVSPIPIHVVFSETVTGFALTGGKVTVTNGTAGSLTGTGTTYDFNVVPTAHGNVTIKVEASAAQDAATNGNTASSVLTKHFDIVNPTCDLSSTATEPTKTAPIPFTATFSAAVTGFEVGDITVGNGSANTLAGGPTVYTFNVVPAGQGAVTVDVAAGVCVDAQSRPNLAATQLSRTFDSVGPTCTLSAPNPTNSTPFTLTITFNEAVQNFIVDDVTVTGANKGTLAGGATVWTLPLTPTAATVTANVAASTCTDTPGNNNTASNILTIKYSANGFNLAAQWNLMSPNLIPNDTDIDAVLADIASDVLAVWYYDATVVAPANPWKGWSPTNPSPTLTTMEDGKGYQVQMANARTLIIDGLEQPAPGSMLPPPSYNVVVGWNMIGFKSIAEMDCETYLNAVTGKYTRVYFYDTSNGRYTAISGATHMIPGLGYWISFTADGTIYP